MNGIFVFKEVAKYIEDNLDKSIDVNEMAKIASLSTYEFRRVFSFVVGLPVGEYIRKRRLSKAGEDLLSGKYTVTEVAFKYGYDATSSFTRAFKSFHGVIPNEAMKGNVELTAYTKVSFDFSTRGGEEIKYTVIDDGGFYVVGYNENSTMEDSECCEKVWNSFYESEKNADIINACNGKIYAVYDNGDNSVECTIGARVNDENAFTNGCYKKYIPPCLWARFVLKGTSDETVNAFYKNAVYEYLHSSVYERIEGGCNLEVFPVDMSGNDFDWEVRIPVRRKI